MAHPAKEMASFLSLANVLFYFLTNCLIAATHAAKHDTAPGRNESSLNANWKFSRFVTNPDSLSYTVLRSWMLPSGNDFIVSGSKHQRPTGTPPGNSVQYVQAAFDDSAWEAVNLPHDWAIKGPFNAPGIGPGMGRLPTNGVGWYRKKFTMASADVTAGKSVFLDIEGAMSYAAVWLNGNLLGGWPYGYASFRLDLTADLKAGENILAIRLDNPTDSSRWYPGAGIYRNVWLTTTDSVHVAQYGTYVTTSSVTAESATVNLKVDVENRGNNTRQVDVTTEIRAFDPVTGSISETVVATFPKSTVTVPVGGRQTVNGSVNVPNPSLWGPPPTQKPNLYATVTTLSTDKIIDTYVAKFGIRSLTTDANKGVLINGQAIRVYGTNNHHDLGSLGSAFNVRAAQRQLQMLQEMGCTALRMSHNPPAPQLLDLADQMGFLVLDEIFDVWNSQKTTNDFHLIFTDWKEPDLRSFIRRDRNHPSVIAWSFGNEVGEQSGSSATTQQLHDIAKAEDSTRGSTGSMNLASAGSAFANVMDIESLNYQGEGIGSGTTSSSFPSFHQSYPNKMIWSSESAAAVSSRGTYLFPVTNAISATAADGTGGNAKTFQVSAYELYAASFGSSADKVFGQQDRYPYVAGEFVWTGWDYLGEPTPFGNAGARSSFFGIIDLAGFKKDRFYLYQSHWRPDLPMAHILPHWTWPDRVGQVTPVHVFSAADEAELFVNGKSAGRLKKGNAYRFRWDNVTYQPGDLRVVAYKNGTQWATDSKKTVGAAAKLTLQPDRASINGDGLDLCFVTVTVVDANGDMVPQADHSITFSISGPAQIVATDNGYQADFTAFPSLTRKAFSGLALAILRANPSSTGDIVLSATASGLGSAQVTIKTI